MKSNLFIPVVVAIALSIQLSAQTQGPFNPGLATNTSCPFSYSSTVDYLPAGNIFASDNSYATASHCDCCDQNTRCLEATNFGFSIPPTAIVDGIVVGVEKRASNNSTVEDNGVRIIKGGITTGIDQLTPADWPYTDTYSTYGGPAYLWGTTWTVADINATNFGIAFASISYTCFGSGTPVTSFIDHIRITVYYTDVTGVHSVSSGSNTTANVFPNPANGVFSVSASTEGELNLFNLMGERVFSSAVAATQTSFNLSYLAKGIYTLVFVSAAGTEAKKLVIE